MTTDRKPEAVAGIIERVFVQARDHDHIAADARHPAMDGNNAIVVMDMKHIDAFAAQCRVLAAQSHQIAREAVLVGHVLVFAFEALPPDQQFGTARPVSPIFVLE